MSRPATPPDELPEVLVLSEAASLMRVAEATLRGWAEAGLIPGEFFGTWRFRKSRLLATLDSPRANELAGRGAGAQGVAVPALLDVARHAGSIPRALPVSLRPAAS